MLFFLDVMHSLIKKRVSLLALYLAQSNTLACVSKICFMTSKINKYWSRNVQTFRCYFYIRLDVNHCGGKWSVPYTSTLIHRSRTSPFKNVLPAVLRPIELRRKQHALPGTLFSNRESNSLSPLVITRHHVHLKYFLLFWMTSTHVCPRVSYYKIDRTSTASTDPRFSFTYDYNRLWPTIDVWWRRFATDWFGRSEA